MVQCVKRVPLRPSPYRSDPGYIPARGPVLHVFPSISNAFLSYSLYNKKDKALKTTMLLRHEYHDKDFKSRWTETFLFQDSLHLHGYFHIATRMLGLRSQKQTAI